MNEVGKDKEDGEPKSSSFLTLSAVANAFNDLLRYVIKLWLELIIFIVNDFV